MSAPRRLAGQRVALALAALAGIVFAGSASAAVSVTDFQGRAIRLAHPAQRIVALAPHLVENLFTAGAGVRIVGAEADSDYPAAARNIPSIGAYHSMSLEKIVALHPDLVLAWASGGTTELVRRLRGLGIPVYVDAPRRLADITKAIKDFGTLAGTKTHADQAARRFRQRISALRRRYAKRAPVSLFYDVWNQPLQTLSDKGLIGDVIDLCGGRNILAHAPTLAPRVSIEAVLARDPQAIVAGGAADSGRSWKAFWQQWPGLRAVRQHNLLSVPADLLSRPTVRLADGARDLCRRLDTVRSAGLTGRQPDPDTDD